MSPKNKQVLRASFTMAAFALAVTAVANMDGPTREKTPAATPAPAVAASAVPR